MNTRKTVELGINKKGITGGKEPKTNERTTASIRKPVCKDGVCTINWKPVKPAA